MDSVREIFYPQVRKTAPHQSTVRAKAAWPPVAVPQVTAQCEQAPTPSSAKCPQRRRRRQKTPRAQKLTFQGRGASNYEAH